MSDWKAWIYQETVHTQCPITGRYICPYCGESVERLRGMNPYRFCPHCGRILMRPNERKEKDDEPDTRRD